MQDFLKLKLQAKEQLGGYPPFCFGGLETSSQATFDPQAIGKALKSQSTILVREQYTTLVHHTSHGAAAHAKNLAFILQKLFIFKAIHLQPWPPCIAECLGLAALCHSSLYPPSSTPAHKHPEDGRRTRPTRGVNIAAVTLYFTVGFSFFFLFFLLIEKEKTEKSYKSSKRQRYWQDIPVPCSHPGQGSLPHRLAGRNTPLGPSILAALAEQSLRLQGHAGAATPAFCTRNVPLRWVPGYGCPIS